MRRVFLLSRFVTVRNGGTASVPIAVYARSEDADAKAEMLDDDGEMRRAAQELDCQIRHEVRAIEFRD